MGFGCIWCLATDEGGWGEGDREWGGGKGTERVRGRATARERDKEEGREGDKRELEEERQRALGKDKRERSPLHSSPHTTTYPHFRPRTRNGNRGEPQEKGQPAPSGEGNAPETSRRAGPAQVRQSARVKGGARA